MPSSDAASVITDLGRLHFRRTGTGPPVVLWHSLFVDSQSWGPLVDAFASSRTVYAIDGPSHGGSEAVQRHFTFDQCTEAAGQALDELGFTEPVDWVGNAWGGHVGIGLAAAEKPRLKTLTTIGTPIAALTVMEKLTKGWPLVALYRLVGPTEFITKALFDSLLGTEAIAAQPDQAAVIMESFRSADRQGMGRAMRSMMVHRDSIGSDVLGRIAVPTLVMSVRDDVTGWRPDEARVTCAAIPDCRVTEVAGTGHISPLLIEQSRIASLISEFWSGAVPRD